MADQSSSSSSDQSKKYKNYIIVENLIIGTTGITSFISLFFIPRSKPFFLSISILNGIISITCGAIGLHLVITKNFKLHMVLNILLFCVIVMNLIGIGSYIYLLYYHILDKPSCSQCGYDIFMFVLFIMYYIFEVFFNTFLSVLAMYEFKHLNFFKVKIKEESSLAHPDKEHKVSIDT